jgi:glycosyltransferase involved in cell wall biosynthesis
MPLERFVFSRAQQIIAISHQIADELVSAYGIPRERIAVIGNGVDCNEFFPGGEKKGRTPFRLLYVGRLAARKNVDVLLRAVAACSTDVQLRIAGTGPEQSKLEALTASLGIQSRVEFLGFRKGPDLLAEYQSADLLVMPSSYEGLPLVALEAKAAGLPILAANFPGASNIISENSGWVVADTTPQSLSRVVDDAARTADKLNSMATCARQEALARFSWDTVIRTLSDQYDSVLRRTRSSG